MSYQVLSEAPPYRPRDKDCALLCICFAIKECCHQKCIDIKYRDIHNNLYAKYSDFWRGLQKKARTASRGDDMVEKECIEVIQGSKTILKPGKDVQYNLKFFTNRRLWLDGLDRNGKDYEIKVQIDLLSAEDDRVKRELAIANKKDALILQTIKENENENHCRNVIFNSKPSNPKLPCSNGFRGKKLNDENSGSTTTLKTNERNAPYITFYCYDKQQRLGEKMKKYRELDTRTMKIENTKWKILKVSIKDHTPAENEDKEIHQERTED